MSFETPQRYRIQPLALYLLFLFSILAGCSDKAGSKIDGLIGGGTTANSDSSLSLNSISNQVAPSLSPISEVQPQAVNPGGLRLSYTCLYDEILDGSVSSSANSCDSLQDYTNSFASFNPRTGVFAWSPVNSHINHYFEFKISVSNGVNVASRVFTIEVGRPNPSPTSSTVSLSAASVVSGSSITATLHGKDLLGTPLTYGGATITFFNSGGTSTGSWSPTVDLGNGDYQATFSAATSGSATNISARIQGNTISTSSPSLTVTPGSISAAQSLVTVSSSNVLAGSNITVLLTAKDAAGNLVTTGGSTVAFTRSGGTSSGNISATTDNLNGTYSATFSGITAGSATTIGATINGVSVATSLPTVQVTVGTISLSQSVVTVSSSTVASDSSVTLRMQAKDANANNLTSGGLIVGFSTLGGTSTGSISATTDNGDGTYTAIFSGMTAGTPTSITGTVTGLPLISAAPNLQVTPGAASLSQSLVSFTGSTVVSGLSKTINLQIKDARGNNANSGGLVIVFTTTGGTSAGTMSATTDNLNGTYSATFTGITAGTPTSVAATIAGQPLTNSSTLQVLPSTISTAKSVISSTLSIVPSATTTTITLQGRDANDNPLTTGGSTVVFSNSSGTSSGVFSATTDNLNGTYTSTFTAASAGSATDITATINGSPVTTVPVQQITVTPGNPAALTFSTQPSANETPTNPFATQPIIRIVDASGNVVTSGPNSTAQVAITLTTIAGAGVLGGSATMNAASGVANFAGRGLNISTTGTYRLTATVSALSLTAQSNTISIASLTPAIATATPLIVSYLRTGFATTSIDTTALIAAPSTVTPSVAAITSTISTTSLITPTGSPTNPTNTPVAANYAGDPSTTWPVTVSNTNTSTCTLLAPFGGVACGTNGFTLTFNDLKNASTSVVSGTNLLQLNDGYINSNTLTVTKFYFDQVTNTRSGNNDLDQARGVASGTLIEPGVVFNNRYYFAGLNASGFTKLMYLDAAGLVKQVSNFRSASSDNPNTLKVFNGYLYFFATTTTNTQELFKMNTSGTVTQLTGGGKTCQNASKSWGTFASSAHSKFYFFFKNSGGFCKIHSIDTGDNIKQVTDLMGPTVDDSTTGFFEYNSSVWFNAFCTTSGWASCPTTTFVYAFRIKSDGNIERFKTAAADASNQNVGMWSIFNGKAYLTHGGQWQALLALDASDTFTRPLTTIGNAAFPTIVFNGELYFIGPNTSGYLKLNKMTTAGVVTQVSNLIGYQSLDDFPATTSWRFLGIRTESGVDKEIYLIAPAKGLMRKLFRLDTSGNLMQMADINSGGHDTFEQGFELPSGPSGVNEFYFTALNSSSFRKIYKVHPQAD